MRKRTFGINIRVTKEEKQKIALNAERCRLTLTEYLRKLSLGQEVKPFPQRDIFRVYKLISELNDQISIITESEIKQRIEIIKIKLRDVYLAECEKEKNEESETTNNDKQEN